MANNTRSWNQPGSYEPDPQVFNDPNVNPFARQVAAASDTQIMSRQREQIMSAAHGVTTEARQMANQLVRALQDVANTTQAHPVIRAMAKSGGSGRDNAAKALDAQAQIINNGIDEANGALQALRPALLAAVARVPFGVSEAQIADKKADLVAALQAAGSGSKGGANAKAQQILRQVMYGADPVMLYVLIGPPMQYQAETLGYRQDVLQALYAAAMLQEYGLHPLDKSKEVEGAELISMLDFLREAIDTHASAATSALNAVAADCDL